MKIMRRGTGITMVLFVWWIGFEVTALHAQNYTWQKLNGPYGNNIINIATIGSSDVFAGTYTQGTGWSRDMGKHWEMMPDSVPTFIGGYLTSKGTILAMSYDTLYRSTDDGTTWESVGLGTENPMLFGGYSFAENVDSGKVYLATNVGLFVSNDDGKSWELTGLEDPVMKIIAVDKGRLLALTDLLYLGIYPIPSGPASVKISDDGGSTWKTRDLPGDGGASDLVIDNKGRWYVSVYKQNVYISSDEGDTWTSLDFPNQYVTKLAISKSGQLLVGYDGGLGIYDDGSRTFKDAGLPDITVSAVQIAQDGAILVGSADLFQTGKSDAIFRSADNGETWQMVGAHTVVPFTMTANEDGDLYVGTSLFGLYHTPDGGSSWDRLFTGSNDFLGITSLQAGPKGNMMLSSLINRRIYYSNDYGKTWNKPVIMDDNIYLVVSQFMYFDERHIWAAASSMFSGHGGGIYASEDAGRTFDYIGLADEEIVCMTHTKDAAFVGTIYGLFETTDNGKTWNDITKNLQNSSFVISVNSLFVTVQGTLLAGTNVGVQRSTDGGTTWKTISDVSVMEVPKAHADQVVAKTFAQNSKGELFAGTDVYGILYSTDDGQSWKSINSGFISDQDGSIGSVAKLVVDKNDNLYAANGNGGVYVGMYHDTPIEKIVEAKPSNVELGQNYPNPFNPTTNIPIHLSGSGNVKLIVFDVLGRKVATLIDGMMRAGNHQVNFNATKLASGIYFYRLKMGNKVMVRKMLLIK